MAEEFPGQGWNVIGTVRPGTRHSKLHELARTAAGRVEIETLDINEPAQIAALRGQCHACPARLARPALPRLPRPHRPLVGPGHGD